MRAVATRVAFAPNRGKGEAHVYSPFELAEEAVAAAETRAIIPIEGSPALVARPDTVESTYVEDEYDERAEEQPELHAAEGIRETRRHKVTAAGLGPQADAALAVDGAWDRALVEASGHLTAAIKWLSPHRGAPRSKSAYKLRTAGLFLGDLVGISGAALWMGETQVNSVLMAVSAATATVTAGLVGKEIKYLVDGYERADRDLWESDRLPDDAKQFRHLFTGPQAGFTVKKWMVMTAASVGLLVSLSVYGLRAITDSTTTGVVFAPLALAVAIGSFISTYAYANEIADVLDSAEAAVDRLAGRRKGEAKDLAHAQHLEAACAAASVADEWGKRGSAARHAVRAVKHHALSVNPAVVGHGRPTPKLAPVGRLPLKGVDS